MRLVTIALALSLGIALPVAAVSERQQTVTPLTPPNEQAVQALSPSAEQHVESFGDTGVQGVQAGYENENKSAVGKASKAAVAVLALGVAVATTIAFLLII